MSNILFQPRHIAYHLAAEAMDMGGFPIRQLLPADGVEQVDPFLLLHHARITVPKGALPLKSGVGPHPHRGFSPVTLIFEGGVHHRDSRGNDHVVEAGGTQWMNAGMGIVHSERPPADLAATGGVQELIQLWVNSPAKNKMDQPVYLPLTKAETPVWTSATGHAINVISGQLENTKGGIPTLSPVNTFTADLPAGAQLQIPLPPAHQAFLYILSGQVEQADGSRTDAHQGVVYGQGGSGVAFTTLAPTRLLLGSGEPLQEPMVSHGPFVMNSTTELMEAFRDYQQGKMGVLIES